MKVFREMKKSSSANINYLPLNNVNLWPTWKLKIKTIHAKPVAVVTCMCSAPCPCAEASLEVQRVGLWSQTWRGRSAAGHQTLASRSQTSPASLPCSRLLTSEETEDRVRGLMLCLKTYRMLIWHCKSKMQSKETDAWIEFHQFWKLHHLLGQKHPRNKLIYLRNKGQYLNKQRNN